MKYHQTPSEESIRSLKFQRRRAVAVSLIASLFGLALLAGVFKAFELIKPKQEATYLVGFANDIQSGPHPYEMPQRISILPPTPPTTEHVIITEESQVLAPPSVDLAEYPYLLNLLDTMGYDYSYSVDAWQGVVRGEDV